MQSLLRSSYEKYFSRYYFELTTFKSRNTVGHVVE